MGGRGRVRGGRRHVVIRKALGDAMRWGVVLRNVAELADPPRPQRKPIRTWTADEASRFVAFVADDRLRALWVLALTTGLRRGELLGLRWQEVDLDAGRLSITQTLVSVGYRVEVSEPKTARSRRQIALVPTAVAELRAHRKRQLEERFAYGPRWADSGYVFASPTGEPMHPQALSDRFERLVKDSGLPRIRLHDLRHGFATIALGRGVPLKVVSSVLGHSSAAFTADVYMHVDGPMAEAATQAVTDAVFAVSVTNR